MSFRETIRNYNPAAFVDRLLESTGLKAAHPGAVKRGGREVRESQKQGGGDMESLRDDERFDERAMGTRRRNNHAAVELVSDSDSGTSRSNPNAKAFRIGRQVKKELMEGNVTHREKKEAERSKQQPRKSHDSPFLPGRNTTGSNAAAGPSTRQGVTRSQRASFDSSPQLAESSRLAAPAFNRAVVSQSRQPISGPRYGAESQSPYGSDYRSPADPPGQPLHYDDDFVQPQTRSSSAKHHRIPDQRQTEHQSTSSSRSTSPSKPQRTDSGIDFLIMSHPPDPPISRPAGPGPSNRRKNVTGPMQASASHGDSSSIGRAISESPQARSISPDKRHVPSTPTADFVMKPKASRTSASSTSHGQSSMHREGFGSHGSSRSEKVLGRKGGGSASPNKKALRTPRMKTIDTPIEELEDIEDRIQSPDGFDQPKPQRSGPICVDDSDDGSDGDNNKPYKDELSKSRPLGAKANRPPTRPMKDKHGNVAPDPGDRSAKSRQVLRPIASSKLAGPREGPVDIEYARFGNASCALRAKTFSFNPKFSYFEMGTGPENNPRFVRLPVDTVGQAIINPGPEKPFMFVSFDTSGLSRVARDVLNNDLQCFTVGMDCNGWKVFDFALAFKETRYPHQCLIELSETLNKSRINVTSVDRHGATALRTQWPELSLRESSHQRRGTRRSGIDRRGDDAYEPEPSPPPRARPRMSDASSSEPGRKGKGKTAKDDPAQSKLAFPKVDPAANDSPAPIGNERPRRSNRAQNPNQAYNVDDSDDDASKAEPPKELVPMMSAAEKNELLFPYPPTGRAELHITGGDRHRVMTGEFLNDTLLEFGLRHRIAGLPEEAQKDVHLFNSFFFDKLSSKSGKPDAETEEWPAYNSVRKWTKGKDIFDKKYVVVPINEAYHWYLAIIVNPAGILQAPPTQEAQVERIAPAVTENAASTSVGRDRTGREQTPAPSVTDSDLLELSSPKSQQQTFVDPDQSADPFDNNYGDHDQQKGVPAGAIGEESRGRSVSAPIDMTGDDGGGVAQTVEGVQQGVKDLNMGEVNMDEEDDGAPILTPTMEAHQLQGQPAPPQVEVDEPAKAKEAIEAQKKLDIVGSDKCWIITCDSLGGAHKAVHTVLERWLQYEARDKLQKTGQPLSGAEYVLAKVPQQTNFSDCGLWVIHYVYAFLKSPQNVLGFIEASLGAIQLNRRAHIQRRAPRAGSADRKAYESAMHDVWQFADTQNMRQEWEGIINSLTQEYRAANPDLFVADQNAEDQGDASQDDVECLTFTHDGGGPNLGVDQPSQAPPVQPEAYNSSSFGNVDEDPLLPESSTIPAKSEPAALVQEVATQTGPKEAVPRTRASTQTAPVQPASASAGPRQAVPAEAAPVQEPDEPEEPVESDTTSSTAQAEAEAEETVETVEQPRLADPAESAPIGSALRHEQKPNQSAVPPLVDQSDDDADMSDPDPGKGIAELNAKNALVMHDTFPLPSSDSDIDPSFDRDPPSTSIAGEAATWDQAQGMNTLPGTSFAIGSDLATSPNSRGQQPGENGPAFIDHAETDDDVFHLFAGSQPSADPITGTSTQITINDMKRPSPGKRMRSRPGPEIVSPNRQQPSASTSQIPPPRQNGAFAAKKPDASSDEEDAVERPGRERSRDRSSELSDAPVEGDDLVSRSGSPERDAMVPPPKRLKTDDRRVNSAPIRPSTSLPMTSSSKRSAAVPPSSPPKNKRSRTQEGSRANSNKSKAKASVPEGQEVIELMGSSESEEEEAKGGKGAKVIRNSGKHAKPKGGSGKPKKTPGF